MEKVIVGLSGGVDSSVALALLKEKGYEVTGVSMKIWAGGEIPQKKKGGCYGPQEEEELKDAERVCKTLKVPFFVFDLSKEYDEE
ncbi:MAG: 7-cyano-7-deazaguanine synthase, partial [Thermoanaerobaculia bacterium]